MKRGTEWKPVNPKDIPEHLHDHMQQATDFFKNARGEASIIVDEMRTLYPNYMFNMSNGILLCAPVTKRSRPARKEFVSLKSDVNETLITFTPPEGVSGKELKTMYRRITGHLPFDWRNRPAIVYKKRTTP